MVDDTGLRRVGNPSVGWVGWPVVRGSVVVLLREQHSTGTARHRGVAVVHSWLLQIEGVVSSQ